MIPDAMIRHHYPRPWEGLHRAATANANQAIGRCLSREICYDMHTRSEPRFQVQSAIRIAAIDQPAQVSDALLLDVSGIGMKIIADASWPVDTLLVVEMENHLVLARVRYTTPRGPKFSLGAERIFSVLKHTLPPGESRVAWHQLLLAEMGEPLELTAEALPPEPVTPKIDAANASGNSTVATEAEPQSVESKSQLAQPEEASASDRQPPAAQHADQFPQTPNMAPPSSEEARCAARRR